MEAIIKFPSPIKEYTSDPNNNLEELMWVIDFRRGSQYPADIFPPNGEGWIYLQEVINNESDN